jgi:hypothetical protein
LHKKVLPQPLGINIPLNVFSVEINSFVKSTPVFKGSLGAGDVEI